MTRGMFGTKRSRAFSAQQIQRYFYPGALPQAVTMRAFGALIQGTSNLGRCPRLLHLRAFGAQETRMRRTRLQPLLVMGIALCDGIGLPPRGRGSWWV